MVALIGAPFFFGNGFFAPAAQAAAAINFITYTSGSVTFTSGATIVPSVYAREAITFTADVTEGAGLIYVWDFGDGESAIGNAAASGSVTHRYDRAFTSTGPIQPTLRLYTATGASPVAERGIGIRVEPLRLPDNYSSLSATDKVQQSDTWPFSHITRADGPGPYASGSQIDFRANASERNFSLSSWKGNDTFQWEVMDSSRAQVGSQVVHATVDATGAFSTTPPSPGWYQVSLRANQSNSVGGGFVDVYDTASHVFFATSDPAAVNSGAFSVDVTSTTSPLTYSGQAEPFSSVNYRANAAVTGGVLPFTYIWNYPNDVPTTEQPNEFITNTAANYDSTNQLNAQFRRSGTKRIYLTVIDGTFRTVTDEITYSIANTNAPAGTTPFSPTLNITASPSPILVTIVEANSKPLTIQVGTGLTPPTPQVYVFRATAANGTPPYQITLSPTNKTATPCTSPVPASLQCEYLFSAYGTFTVEATVVDGSSPPQQRTYQQNVVIQQQGAAPPPGGGTDTGGTGTGGTGSTGTGTGGTAAVATPLDPRASNYGLASTFSKLGVGKSNDLKSTIALIINIVLGFLGIVAVVFIIFGGIKIMTAAGNEEATTSGRQAITAGVIGLIIVFAAWAIASFVINNLASATA